LYFKRLEHGKFHWSGAEADGTIALSREELSCLIGSAKLTKKLARNEVSGRLIA